MNTQNANIQPSSPNKRGQYSIYYTAKNRTFTCRTNAGNPERQTRASLDRSGSQLEHRICVTLTARGFSHIINAIL